MTLVRSTVVGQEPRFTQELLPYSNHSGGDWASMNDYPQSTMAGYGSNEFVYMPHSLSHASPQQTHTPQMHQSPIPHQQHQQHQQQHQDQSQTPQDHTQSHHLQQQHPQHHQSPALIQPSPQQQPLPQLPMMMVPSTTTWPSMLITSGNSYPTPTMPTLAPPATITPTTMATAPIAPGTIAPPTLAPAPPPAPAVTTPSPAPLAPRGPQPPPIRTSRLDREGRPAPRKMLTDEDRRNMCLYALKNPNAKQNEIGAEFGVERSTVSKVLRHKERYLNYNNEERNTSPGRRNRNKSPDIERALENWARNQRKHLRPVTEDDIQERIRCFTSTSSDPSSGRSPVNEAWLKSFREKYCTGPGRLARRASETNIPKRHAGSPSLGSLKQSNGRSSTSPSIGPTESPHLSQQVGNGTGLATSAPSGSSRGLMSFADHAGGSMGPHGTHADNAGHGGNGMNGGLSIRISMTGADTSNSQSATALSSAFTETPVSSFPDSALSSTMPFTFSPDSTVGSFLPHDAMESSGASNFQRPRSQTLPALNLEYMAHPQSQHAHHDNTTLPPVESMTPRYHYQQIGSAAPSSAVDSPMTDISAPSYGIDSTVVSPQLRRSSSNNSLFMGIPRSAGGLGGATIGTSLSALGGSSGSSPSSLTQEDAQRSADMLLAYMQACPSTFDQTELMAIARLTEKLRTQQTQQPLDSRVTLSPQGMGGLSRIPEGDVEMANDMQQHIKMETPMAS